ncbi:hypothetical protein [Trichormus variabilis]|uniref:Uncharacterized protein n=1 Tax=Trichormus variabilis N2B TaxID=2681315 RepID=A0ABR6SGG8_ANAVA|nr:hypothetical protein [Trichormus variabilis]MBC1259094.1 hypothetical protein [Trichormus variabilis V5]MBC1305492.1 hypothetical protein [Trichormus variabilis N2B]MBC1329846.1 hypothetical protein [Trichormus variabilis 9RC]
MKHVQPAMYQSLITHSSLTPSSVTALQQLDSGVKLLARPHSSRRHSVSLAARGMGVLDEKVINKSSE